MINIFMAPTEWYAATPANGKFSIANIPPGDYDLHSFTLAPMRKWVMPLLHDAQRAV